MQYLDNAVGAILGLRMEKSLTAICYMSKTFGEAHMHYMMTKKELLEVVYAFEKLWPYILVSKIIIYTNHVTLKYLVSKEVICVRKRLFNAQITLQKTYAQFKKFKFKFKF